MADVFSKAKHSEVMARIRSRGNKDTELALAKRGPTSQNQALSK